MFSYTFPLKSAHAGKDSGWGFKYLKYCVKNTIVHKKCLLNEPRIPLQGSISVH